jgi:arylsulfatase A-like enzyme
LYGLDRPHEFDRHYALQCLRARRLVEAGVRFVEVTCPLTHPNNAPWDQHGDMRRYHGENARITDQPVAALIKDLKQRGLLDETLVLWAGEMGRTPHSAGTDGRDHHVAGYTVCMAGGGIRGGTTFGATDEMGMAAVEDPIDVHDLHATLLHQLGVDHEQLTFRFGGRDVRLTDVHGRVLRQILR